MKSVSMLGKLHECPDGKHNSDDEHSDEESQGVHELRTEVTEGGMSDP